MTHQILSQELERQIKPRCCFPGVYIPMGVKPIVNDQIYNTSRMMNPAEKNEGHGVEEAWGSV